MALLPKTILADTHNSTYTIQNSPTWRNLPLISTPETRPCPWYLDTENPSNPPSGLVQHLARLQGSEADRLEKRIQIMSDQGLVPATVSSPYRGIVKVKLDSVWTDKKLGKYTFILKTKKPGMKHILQTPSNGTAVIKLGDYDRYVDASNQVIRPEQIQIITKQKKAIFPNGLSKDPEDCGLFKTSITYDVNPEGKATFIQHSIPEMYVFNPETELWEKAPMNLAHAVLNYREGASEARPVPTWRPLINRDNYLLRFKQQGQPVSWDLVLDPDFRDNPWTRDFIENEFIPLIVEPIMTNGSIHFDISYGDWVKKLNLDDVPIGTVAMDHDPSLGNVAGAAGTRYSDGTYKTGITAEAASLSLRDDGPVYQNFPKSFRKVLTHEFGSAILGCDGENKDFTHLNSWNEGSTPSLLSPGIWDRWLTKLNFKIPRGSYIKSKKVI